MPTYQYRCRNCDNAFEIVQKFTDDALTVCPECHEEALRKVYNAVGVVFKGSGFYRTDSRKDGPGATVPAAKSENKTDSTKSDSATGSAKSSGDGGSGAASAGSTSSSTSAASSS